MTPFLLWKTIVLLILSIVLLDAQSYIGSGSSWPIIPDSDVSCNIEKRTFVADNRSLCWFYQCQPSDSGQYLLFPRRCSLGTYVNPNYRKSTYNPCTQRFPILGMYDCTRRGNEAEVDCKKDLKCNGGTAMQQDNICWCACPPGMDGAADCSKAKGRTPSPAPTSPCPDIDWCKIALNGDSPCQNGGTCYNQCTNFYCQCPVPYTNTRYCERFSCSTTNFTCTSQSENCTRGLNGKDEFYVCRSGQCADYLKPWTM